MAKSITLPIEELRNHEIRDALNQNGGHCDNVQASLFMNGNLNWTSKYKPVCHSDVFADREIRRKGEDGNCGLVVPVLTNYIELPDFYNEDGSEGMNGWEYIVPDGNPYPMITGDFRGYHTVVSPFAQGFYVPEKGEMTPNSTLECMIMVGISSGTNLAISDIKTIEGCTFGVYAVQGTKYRLAFGDTNSHVSLPCHDMSLGEWKVYPFFTNSPNKQHGQGVKYYPIPSVGIRFVEMVENTDAIQLQITGYFYAETKVCTWEVKAFNTSSADTISGGSVFLKYADHTLADPLDRYEKQERILDNIEVPHTETLITIASGRFDNIVGTEFYNELGDFTGKLWFAFGGGRYASERGVPPMKDPAGKE